MAEQFDFSQATPGTLRPISRDQYDYMLNVLPPKSGRGCFAMGEPVSEIDGHVTYHWAAKRGDRYLTMYGSRVQADAVFNSAEAWR